MIRIAIVEDDDQYAATLCQYLERYETESSYRFLVQRFRDGADLVADYQANVDLILMDIEMAEMDGMTAAERIREVDREVVIIFITNMMHYAMKGYAVEALDYVLKPIHYFSFSQRLSRALERMNKRQSKTLLISRYGNVKKISSSDLQFVSVYNHDIEYHTTQDVIRVRGTLKEVEKDLAGLSFFRCNSGCLVNLDYVDELLQNEVVVAGESIPISRGRKKEFLDRMNTYLNEVSK